MNLENYGKILEKRAKIQKSKGIHSYAHEITLSVVEWVDEMYAFGKWLGITLRIGPGRMKDLLNQMKDKNIKSAKYLMACTKNK